MKERWSHTLKIREVIVVEGRDDTVAVKRALDADTIETGGSALGEDVYVRIELAMATRGVIILTDPDFAGERIRKLVARRVPGCKHAFIDAEQGTFKGKFGVEYAPPEVIRAALADVHSEDHSTAAPVFTIADLMSAGLVNGPDSHGRRTTLGKLLRIGSTNGKQLLKRLNMFHITRTQFDQALQEMEEQR
jgi:ribonuclease M5